MTIKTLFFSLFLYVCLVWIGAAYLKPDDIVQYGLLWTAIGLIVVLLLIIGARVYGWWRLWHAKAVARQTAPARPAPLVHEDDAALAALIAEANVNLAKSPDYAGQQLTTPLAGKSLYLLIGPEGSGKTSTFVNSGLEPQLLAGQVSGTGPGMPTRLCNIWAVSNSIFVELSGRAFGGDGARWTQLLRGIRGESTIPTWRRLWREPAEGMVLRGVVAFCDAKEFTGTPNSEVLDRRGRDMQDRLQGIGDVFGVDFPVYQVFTKSDAIPYFPEFFRRLPETEASQVFGCTLAVQTGTANASADEKAKQLTRTFRPLYQEIASRRLTQLAHEPDPSQRPAVYEFPRELKRIRTPLLQFLSDTFRPHPLRLGPLLRGYYLTGIREVEVAQASVTETRANWGAQKLDATRLFSAADATRMFRPGEMMPLAKPSAGGITVRRWIFTSDLFRSVVLTDRPPRRAQPVDQQVEYYRKAIYGAVCGFCLLLCFAFLWSWSGNRAVLHNIREVTEAGVGQPGKTMIENLTALEALRAQLQHLIEWQRSTPWGLNWGLYSGNRLLDEVRRAYFADLKTLLLGKLNGAMVTHLQDLPAIPPEGEQEDAVYRMLQTHLIIAGTCPAADPAVVSGELKSVRGVIQLAAASGEAELADKQIEFYAKELPHESLWRLASDPQAISQARLYLENTKGIDRIYRAIISGLAGSLPKPIGLAEIAPKYTKVLRGQPTVPSAVFTPEGWKRFEKESKRRNRGTRGDPCVAPVQQGGTSSRMQDVATTARRLQEKFIAEYIAQWRNFVRGFSVLPYAGVGDAANKLQILADYKSPLLAVFALTSNQTNFPATPQDGVLDKAGETIGNKVSNIAKALKVKQKVDEQSKKAEIALENSKEVGPAGISRVFQPVHWVVPPDNDKWVNEKSNAAYIQALEDLGRSMQAVDSNKQDPSTQQAFQTSYEKALGAAKQIEMGFRSVGDDGVDVAVQSLLEQPIHNVKGLIITDPLGSVNGELRALCLSVNPVLRKYPFRKSAEDVSPDEFTRIFGPQGSVWKFSQKLGDYAVKEGSQWKVKDPTKKTQITSDMLSFLTQAQGIADVFYAAGPAPSLNYIIRPKPDNSLKDWTLSLVIDGQDVEWTSTSGLQRPFIWPAGPGREAGARGFRTTGGAKVGFASRGGLWGIFRMIGDAEQRPPMGKLIEWKYLRGGEGRPEPIQPPVRLEIVRFPGDVDVFNPKFFENMQCPPKALQ